MNAFTEQDAYGRDKTINLFPKLQMVASVDQFAVWDLSGCTKNIAGDETPFLIEIKDRKVSSTQYDTVYLEYKKYKSLMELAYDNNIIDIFYINHYTDNITYVFNLKNYKPYALNLVIGKAPKTTYGNTEYVDKIFVELPIQQGSRYRNKQ